MAMCFFQFDIKQRSYPVGFVPTSVVEFGRGQACSIGSTTYIFPVLAQDFCQFHLSFEGFVFLR